MTRGVILSDEIQGKVPLDFAEPSHSRVAL